MTRERYVAGPCLVCRHCRAALFALGPRLTDGALRCLADHVRQVHPSVALRAEADAGTILALFAVERAP